MTNNEERPKVTGEEFLLEFIDSRINLKRHVTTDFVLNPNKTEAWDCGQKHIFNCVFDDEVTFENYDTKLLINFNKCVFAKGLKFIGCVNEENTINLENCEIVNITINNCKVSALGIINNDKKDQIIDSIDFYGGSIDEFNIKNIKINSISLGFESKYKSLIKNLYIVDADILERFRAENIKIETFILDRGVFDNTWGIQNCVIIRKIIFNNTIANKEIFLQIQDELVEEIRIVGGVFKKHLSIGVAKTPRNVKEVKTVENLFLTRCKFESQFHINDIVVKNLEVVVSELTGIYRFIGSDIHELTLRGVDNKASFNFEECRINKVMFERFRTNEGLIFSDLRSLGEDSELSIMGSHLGKTLFSNTNLKSFKKINIQDSMIQEINSTGVEWFSDTQLNIAENKKAEDWKKDREVFRQIKQSLEKQGSNIDALTFKAYEVNAYRK